MVPCRKDLRKRRGEVLSITQAGVWVAQQSLLGLQQVVVGHSAVIGSVLFTVLDQPNRRLQVAESGESATLEIAAQVGDPGPRKPVRSAVSPDDLRAEGFHAVGRGGVPHPRKIAGHLALAQPSADRRPPVPFEFVVAPATLPHPVFRTAPAAAKIDQWLNKKARLAEAGITVRIYSAMHRHQSGLSNGRLLESRGETN